MMQVAVELAPFMGYIYMKLIDNSILTSKVMESNKQDLSMELLSDMMPSILQEYTVLLEHQLKQAQLLFEERHLTAEEPYRQILKNQDIQMYTIRKFDDETIQELQSEEEEINQELKKKIQQYNRIAKPSRGRDRDKNRRGKKLQDSQEAKPRRKVRTTITPAKLQEMNRIFKQYLQTQQKNKIEHQGSEEQAQETERSLEMESLKSIGEKLGLGYSTILHKFRQFRATKKVKGGALIAALNQKRKYKKSKQIQELILKSLNEGTFYTAVELATHIKNNYGKVLSRSIISRHLGEMGYSYKNIKSKPTNRNSPHIKELRKKFSAAFCLLRDKYQAYVYYIDQYTFSLAELPRKQWHDPTWARGQLFLTILASPHGVIKYELRKLPMQSEEFEQFLAASQQCLAEVCPERCRVIVMDMDNPLHFCDGVMRLRKQMHSRNTKLFYLPPQSHQLNVLEWVFAEMRQSLMSHEYQGLQDLRLVVEEELRALCGGSLQSYSREAEGYLRKGMGGQNF